MVFKIDEHTGILIKKAARLIEQVANRNLDKLGVTYSKTLFLVRLWEKDRQTQVELAKSAGLKQPSVVRILDKMERDHLIIRERNKKDRRVFNFSLTEKAKNACRKLEEYLNETHQIATKDVAKKDVDKLNQLLSGLIANLKNNLADS